jgi:heptosyltransferase-2
MSESRTEPRKILVRGVNWLGDAVMTTPALMRLRERFPEARITMLCHEKLLGLWTAHPAINDVRTFGDNDGPITTGRRLADSAYDLSVIFPNSIRSALESFVARIPRRVGSASSLRGMLLTDRVKPDPTVVKMRKRKPAEVSRLIESGERAQLPAAIPPQSHQIHHYLRIVGALGADTTPLPTRLALAGGDGEDLIGRHPAGVPIVGLNPGAEYGPAKRWPVERFADAANALHAKTGCRFVVFGGKGDLVIAGQLTRRITSAPVTVLAGRTSLSQLLEALGRCHVLLTNDTGPMHVAAALGVPVVVPFGSTSPELTGPGLPGDPRHKLIRSNAECAPCFLRECPVDFRCMKRIEVGEIVHAVEQCLQSRV